MDSCSFVSRSLGWVLLLLSVAGIVLNGLIGGR